MALRSAAQPPLQGGPALQGGTVPSSTDVDNIQLQVRQLATKLPHSLSHYATSELMTL